MEVTSSYEYPLYSDNNFTYTYDRDYNPNISHVLPHGWLIWVIITVLTSTVGLITNGIAVAAIYRKSYKKSAWDVLFSLYCVLNVCILVDSVMFMIILRPNSSGWILPDWMCPTYHFFSFFIRILNNITLAILSFVSLVFFKDIGKRCLSFELLLIFASIFTSTVISIPKPFFMKVVNSGYHDVLCRVDIHSLHLIRVYNIVSVVFTVILPVAAAVSMSVLFLVMKIRSREFNKIIVLRVSVTVIFVVLWFPTWVFALLFHADAKILRKIKFQDVITLSTAFGWLLCLESCLPSIAFLILNKSARQSLCCWNQNNRNRHQIIVPGVVEIDNNILLQTNEQQ